jgi:hypothetical protein
MTAGHNALRRSGPRQQHAFNDAMAQVGCPDRRIDALRQHRPSLRREDSSCQPGANGMDPALVGQDSYVIVVETQRVTVGT